MSEWTVEFYRLPSGRAPVQDYISRLPPIDRRRVLEALEMLEEHGASLQPPMVRALGDKLFELRIVGRNDHHVFYVVAAGRRLVLVHAISKKSQKTPPHDLELARKRARDVLW